MATVKNKYSSHFFKYFKRQQLLDAVDGNIAIDCADVTGLSMSSEIRKQISVTIRVSIMARTSYTARNLALQQS